MDPQVAFTLNKVIERGLKRLPPGMRPAMVVSHERSGTHFTMNSLAACFGYASQPWVDFDATQVFVNYFHPEYLRELVNGYASLRALNLIKSHHEFGFFAPIIDQTPELEIVYVHRRPADVMSSLWRFVHTLPWIEGPRVDSLVEFASTAPMGQLMRYQMRQYDTMLDRWANHVRGWTQAAERYSNVHVVRYEDLAGDYVAAIGRLASELGLEPIRMVRPHREVNVVGAGPAPFRGVERPQDRNLVWQLAQRRHPELMRRLGYMDPPAERSAA